MPAPGPAAAGPLRPQIRLQEVVPKDTMGGPGQASQEAGKAERRLTFPLMLVNYSFFSFKFPAGQVRPGALPLSQRHVRIH